MPELPEVEVTKMGIQDTLLHATITDVFKGQKSLREKLSDDLYKLKGGYVTDIARRGKYILVYTTHGTIIIHLGMSGHLSVVDEGTPRVLHDHFALHLDNHKVIKLNDARRFGLVLFIDKDKDPFECKYLKVLGVEPFSDNFNATYLKNVFLKKHIAIKQAIMDSHIVVGVGNIYASESLFLAKINPKTPANKVSEKKLKVLVTTIKDLLKSSIAKGGTTIRDFQGADGKMGYFVQNLYVYGHEGELCKICGHEIVAIEQGQRRTYYCPHCQKA